MLTLTVIWLVVLGLILLVWSSRHIELTRGPRSVLTLVPRPPEADRGGESAVAWPAVSMLIAAKDEQRVIEQAVRTAIAQDYSAVTGAEFELLIINDRSSDATESIVQRLMGELNADASNPRLRLLTIRELRPGWFGKNNAMDEGVRAARHDYLVFSDADCRFTDPSCVRVAVGTALREKADLLSVLPELERRSFWEAVVQPAAGAVMIFWFHPGKVNNPSLPNAYANGAFMSMSRATYERLGGHSSVKTEVNEDVVLARRAKQMGLRLFVCPQAGLYVCHMYTGFRQIWRGWSRIFYGCFEKMRHLRVSLIFLLTFSLFPWFSFLAGLIWYLNAGWQTRVDAGWVMGLSLAIMLMQQTVIARFYALSRVSPWWAPTYILGACICTGMMVNAMVRKAGWTSTTWRGTVYRKDQVVGS